MRLPALMLLVAPLATGCAGHPDGGAAVEVTRIADQYLQAYVKRAPELGTRLGLPGADHGRVVDNSPAAIAAWRKQEDAWLARLQAIDTTALRGSPEWVTYGVLREMLEDSIAVRICRMEQWNVNAGPAGWQAGYAALAGLQPVGSDSLRTAALARTRGLPRYLANEEAALGQGLAQGRTAPRVIVESVIRQLDGLLADEPDGSPFASPAARDSSPAFTRALVAAIRSELYPAVRQYRDFLARDYLPRARASIGVGALPDGERCYRALVRRFTTLDRSPDAVFSAGQREMARIETEMRELARRGFGTSDVSALLRRLRQDPAMTYRSREEVVTVSRAAIARARAAMASRFGTLPRADVEIRQHPEFRQRAGAVAQYSGPSEDGTRPGVFWISTWRPELIPRAYGEATAFHEAIPGHHLQVAIARERRGAHPLTRYFFFSGFGEGWALYAEVLADEMGLYSDDVARMGLLASQAWRAARLVVDAGIHARGWSRDRAVAYLGNRTTMSPVQLEGEIDRYISWPGQATSYMLGNLEIRAIREEAERRLGSGFDIRAFHDQVLGNGAVTLPMLRTRVAAWMEQSTR